VQDLLESDFFLRDYSYRPPPNTCGMERELICPPQSLPIYSNTQKMGISKQALKEKNELIMSYRTLTQFLENFNCSIILIHARINNRGLFGWWLEKGAWARQTSQASNFLDTWGHDLLPGQANACQASI